MNAIAETSQSLTPGDIVQLFILDLAPIGVAQQYYFTNSTIKKPGTEGEYQTLKFGGYEFAPVDVTTSGWEVNGQGPWPRPKVSISNAMDFLSGLLFAYDDLVGARFTRIRTYRQFLDDGETPDPDAFYPPDIYRVERKVKHNSVEVEFELAAYADQQGLMLPKRKMFRDTCTHSYRIPRPNGSFDYSRATCPYTGSACFDIAGNPTTPDKDECGRQLSDCKKRFRSISPKEPLPTRAFPGLIRTTYQ